MALLNFNASTVQPDMGMDVLPVGWYNVAIDQSEMKPTRDNATTGGAYLELRFNVLDGQFAGRKLFARLNLKNQNPTAVEIAYKELSAICHATGVIQVQDSHELHGKPLKVRVKIRKGDGEYEDQNNITAYKNINEPTGGASAPTALHAPAAAAAAAATSPGFPAQPWMGGGAPAMTPPMTAPGMPPAGFTPPAQLAQPAAPQVAPQVAPVAVQPPAVPQAAPAPVAPPQPVKTMTAKANGATLEQFLAGGWKEEQMVEQGYLTITMPAVPAAQVVPQAAPAAPQAAQPPVGPASPTQSLTPPWAGK